jgi:eukaryotic-like serine/threonine-protein kinase
VTVDRLASALAAGIGDRTANVDVTVLNPALCGLTALLPAVPAGSVSVRLGYGDRPDANPTGVYSVGDNPTIDVMLPADASDGYLWVAIADVTGTLINLLPNVDQPEAGVAGLGSVEGDMRRIRVAYSLAEFRDDPRRPALQVDPNFGKSLMVVFRSDRPLFDTLRPKTESIASFVEDLGQVLQAGQVRILSLNTQLIESRE